MTSPAPAQHPPAGTRVAGRILVVEPNPTGHRLNFVRLIVERATALGRDVKVALAPDAESTEEYAEHVGDLRLGPALPAVSHDLAELRELASQSGAAWVVVPDGDAVALALGRGGRWPKAAGLSVLVMRATAQPGRSAAMDLVRRLVRRSLLLAAAARPRVRVAVLSSGWRAPRSLIPMVGDPISLSVGPDTRAHVRERHGLEPGRYWFGILGVVDGRKNVALVAEALLRVGRPVGLVVAGKVEPAVLRSLHQMAPDLSTMDVRVVVVDRMLTAAELDEYVLACDCLVLAHSNEGPSGLFGKALLAGTRVVAAGSRWLRADAAAVPDHASWSPCAVAPLAAAMARAIDAPRPRSWELPSVDAFVDALL